MKLLHPHLVVVCASKYLGAPYRHQGRCRHTGMDCLGLLVQVAIDLGIKKVPAESVYTRYPTNLSLHQNLIDWNLKQVERDSRPGDVLTFWIRSKFRIQHLAIRSFHGIIHTDANVKEVVEVSFGEFWEKRVAGVFVLPGVEDLPWQL